MPVVKSFKLTGRRKNYLSFDCFFFLARRGVATSPITCSSHKTRAHDGRLHRCGRNVCFIPSTPVVFATWPSRRCFRAAPKNFQLPQANARLNQFRTLPACAGRLDPGHLLPLPKGEKEGMSAPLTLAPLEQDFDPAHVLPAKSPTTSLDGYLANRHCRVDL